MNDHLSTLKRTHYVSMLNPLNINFTEISEPQNFLKVMFWSLLVLIFIALIAFCVCGLTPCSLCLKLCTACVRLGFKVARKNPQPPPETEMDPLNNSFEPFVSDAANWITDGGCCLFKHPQTGSIYQYDHFDNCLRANTVVVARNVQLPRYFKQNTPHNLYPNPPE